jgi:hypothetical protein
MILAPLDGSLPWTLPRCARRNTDARPPFGGLGKPFPAARVSLARPTTGSILFACGALALARCILGRPTRPRKTFSLSLVLFACSACYYRFAPSLRPIPSLLPIALVLTYSPSYYSHILPTPNSPQNSALASSDPSPSPPAHPPD